jgi:hypothetical protein
MHGINVAGWSGSRTPCAKAANRMAPLYLRAGDGLFSHNGRRVPMPEMGVSRIPNTVDLWEKDVEILYILWIISTTLSS